MNLLTANDRIGEYPPSFYAAVNTPLPPFPVLEGETRADVCVVGAGYTGLSAARHLAERGFDVAVVEASRVGFGASGRNGGQVGSGQRLEQDTLEGMVGKTDARRLWDLAQEANGLVRDLTAQMNIPYRPGIAHACRTMAEVDHARHMADHLARHYAYDHVQPMDAPDMAALIGTERYKGGDLDHGGGHIDPLAYALGLARTCPARIFERSTVTRIDGTTVHTATGHVRADHVLLACNGYLGDLEPQVAARVMPINNFIVATEPLAPAPLSRPVAVADTKFVVNYWRMSDDNRLLFGGGESYGYRFPDIERTVRKPLAEVYPHLRDVRIDYAWGGTLAITMNRMPCFRQVAPNVLSVSGYSGHGVAMATLAGRILAEAVAGQAERFDLMARLPQTRFPGGVALRAPLLALAMTWYAMRDRLGV